MDILKKRRMTIVVSVVVMLCLGLLYAWSIFVAPLEQEFGWQRIQTSITFTITMCSFTLGNFLASSLTRYRGLKFSYGLSSFLVLIGLAGASRIHTLEGFYLTYGLATGLGIGIAYNVTISNINRWYPDKQGFASGIVLMGFGTGSMLLGTVAAVLIQSAGWRMALLSLAILFSLVLIIAAFLVISPPTEAVFPVPDKRSSHLSEIDLTPMQMLKTTDFYFYFFWTVMVISGGLMVIGNAAPMAVELGGSVSMAVLFAGLLSLCNGVGRMLYGLLYDKHGLITSLLVSTGMFFGGGIFLILAYALKGISLVPFSYLLIGLSCGSVSAITAVYMQEFYGVKYLNDNLSWASVNTLITSLIGPTIAGSIQTHTGSYKSAVVLLPCFALVAFLLILGIRKDNRAWEIINRN